MSTNSAVSDSGAKPSSNTGRGNVMVEVANKISGAKNVLVALSSNPSVDEMAAAIGLTLYLDRLGKRATAIYSGTTPNALEFLEPEKTFESTADTLQDFVIALNKDKADHLRYKLDGEYVKIYITPYKTRIDSRDLEFSYGDYNVDLVIALDVMNGSDLDAALREHGRIMHDASVINITTGDPGKLGEVEWNDKSASSVSEMIAKLLYSASGEATIEKDDATAFLTGIVAATNRFSNAKTTPNTMQIASRLMESGANQQLVSKNITPDAMNKLYEAEDKLKEVVKEDPTKLRITHDAADAGQKSVATAVADGASDNVSADAKSSTSKDTARPESDLMNDLKEAAAGLAQAGDKTVPEAVRQPMKIDSDGMSTAAVESELKADFDGKAGVSVGAEVKKDAATPNNKDISALPVLPPVMPTNENVGGESNADNATKQSATIAQGDDMAFDGNKKVLQPAAEMPPVVAPSKVNEGHFVAPAPLQNSVSTPSVNTNPASIAAPQVASNPEINGVPEMNFMPLPGQEILPPPPTPPLDMSGLGNSVTGADAPLMPPTGSASDQDKTNSALGAVAPGVAAASSAPAQPMSLGPQPAMQDQVYTPQAVDPGAFKIPGM